MGFMKPKEAKVEDNKTGHLAKMAAIMSLAFLSLGAAKESQAYNRDKKITPNLEVANKFLSTASEDNATWSYFTKSERLGPEIPVGAETPFGKGVIICNGSAYNNPDSKIIFSKITEDVNEQGEKVEHKTVAIDIDADGDVDFIANKTMSEKELGFSMPYEGMPSVRETADGTIHGITPNFVKSWQAQEEVNKNFFNQEVPSAVVSLSADGGLSERLTMKECEEKVKGQFSEKDGYYVVSVTELEKSAQEEIQAGFSKTLQEATKVMEDAKSKRPTESGRYNAHEGYGQQY